MSTIKFDTWKKGDGTRTYAPVTAWLKMDASSGSPVLNGSLNISSITDNGQGDFTPNFATAMANANYGIAGYASFDSGANPAAIISNGSGTQSFLTTSFRFQVAQTNSPATALDSTHISVLVVGGI